MFNLLRTSAVDSGSTDKKGVALTSTDKFTTPLTYTPKLSVGCQ